MSRQLNYDDLIIERAVDQLGKRGRKRMVRAYWRNSLYNIEHKLNVLIECWHEGLYVQGIIHDLSKFSPAEFLPYSRRFFSDKKNPEELAWKYAWLHHQHRNRHHWNYWVVDQSSRGALPMPREYLVEMVCDWRAFSRRWGRKVREPSLQITDKMVLHPRTMLELEAIIKGS